MTHSTHSRQQHSRRRRLSDRTFLFLFLLSSFTRGFAEPRRTRESAGSTSASGKNVLYRNTKPGITAGRYPQTRLTRKRMLDEERTDRPMYKISPPCYRETKRSWTGFLSATKKVHCIPGLQKKATWAWIEWQIFLLVSIEGCPFFCYFDTKPNNNQTHFPFPIQTFVSEKKNNAR